MTFQQQISSQANSPIRRSDSVFLEDKIHRSEFFELDNDGQCGKPDSVSIFSAVYSLSESDRSISLSSCSSGHSQEKDPVLTDSFSQQESKMLFLPPSNTHSHDIDNHNHNASIRSTSSRPATNDSDSEVLFPLCKQHNSFPMYFDSVTETSDVLSSKAQRENETNLTHCEVRTPQAQGSDSFFEIDYNSMREKLEAQKEYLVGSFQKQTSLPQTWTTLPKYPGIEKKGNLKMKERLRKFGRAARRFLDTKVWRRQPAMQRCEIQLDGFDDSIERLLLVTCQRGSRTGAETVYISMPSFFETNRVTLPRFMLPSKPGEMVTVSVYGVTGQELDQLPNFRKVVVSGVCTVHHDSRALMTGRLELQPHRPCHSLTGHNKGIQSGGSSAATSHTDLNSYTFTTTPTPVAKDFTELCVLQSAQPFTEFIALATSTCDHPATFLAQLESGKYHAASLYRLARASGPEVFSVASATPTAFFKTYIRKTEVGDMMKQAAELAIPGVNKEPFLLHSLSLLKPPECDLEVLMNMFHTGYMDSTSKQKSMASSAEEGLHFCAWDLKRSTAAHSSASGNRAVNAWCDKDDIGTDVTNPRLLVGNRSYTQLPSLSVFNMSTQLYFADYWSYYDRHFVTLVLCTKRSPCDVTCKKHLLKLDPYNNPFLFRKRYFEPEPSIAVYASANVDVEVIYSDSAAVQKLISICSENVYFSKVRVENK